MNYLMVDISGKVPNYDIALSEAISKVIPEGACFKLFSANIDPQKIECDAKRLISLIPKSLQNSENKFKRAFKALEGILNYIYLILYVLFHKEDVIHFQWLPFLEVSSIEKYFLKLIKVIAPKSKLILTVHNIFPHNSSDSKKDAYRKRFSVVEKYFDAFILHLNTSKDEFCKTFAIDAARCQVIHHGVFAPKNLKVTPRVRGEKLNLIMYGNQSYYKGTDILVDALNLLPKDCQDKVHTVIVGKIDSDYYVPLKKKTEGLDVEWIPKFVPDIVLYNKIAESDVVVIPYREISQSGVLLLAISFKRMIIASDLPSFKETLVGFSDDMFFESGNAESLVKVIKKYLASVEKIYKCETVLDRICKRNSWDLLASEYLNFVYANNTAS